MAKKTKLIHVGDDDYTVGYGRPPKATQFPKGVSGNREGRKRRTAYEEDEAPIRKFMMELKRVKIGGKWQWVARYELLMMKLYEQAMAGNPTATRQLIQASGGYKDFREEYKRQVTQADLEAMEEVSREAEKWLADIEQEKRQQQIYAKCNCYDGS